MTAKELDTLVKNMKPSRFKITSRMDIEHLLYCLQRGLRAIEYNELAGMLVDLFMEIDSIETTDIVEMGTFL